MFAPAVQVLYFVEKQVGFASRMGKRIEAISGNVVFNPVGDTEDGVDRLAGRGQSVAQDPPDVG